LINAYIKFNHPIIHFEDGLGFDLGILFLVILIEGMFGGWRINYM